MPIQRSARFEAYHVLPDSPQMQTDFLYVMASLAKRAAQSSVSDVVRVAEVNAILPVEVQGFQEFPGRGFGGLVTLPNEHRPRAVVAGSRAFLEESGFNVPDILEVAARTWESERGKVILLAGWDGWVRGVLKFSQDGSQD